MESENTLNVLLIHDEVDEANRLVSLLRNANYIIDPHYAASAEELNRRIQERNWELILAQYTAESVPSRTILHQIRRVNKDIPVIFILPEFDASIMVDALKAGAADAVPLDEDQLFIQVAARALYNLDQRRRLRYWKRRFSESEDRFENLILSSQDGIAIIKEGMYVHVNNTFARFFGFPDEDSMTLVPVFDTIARGSQGEFKKFLKPLDSQDAWDVETIRFEGLTPEGEPLPVQATLSQIDFHGEPALQLLVKKDFILHRDEGAPVSTADAAPETADAGKIRLQEMVEGINAAIRKAANTGVDALLFYIQVDQYEKLQKQLGIGTTEQGIVQLARFLESLIPDKVLFGRIREEGMVLVITSNDTEKGLALGNRLVREASNQIFAADDGSFSCTLSIGITPIGEATASADECLASCEKAVAELQKAGGGDGRVGNGVKLHEALFEHSADQMSEQDIVRIGRQLLKKELVYPTFQPILSLQGGNEEIYEVLTRIKSEAFTEGEIPSDFITKIYWSEIGLEFDRAIMARAMVQLAEKKKSAPNTRLVLNLSQKTIEDEKFVPWLQKAVEKASISPGDLLFQMREIDVSRQLGRAVAMIERLRNIGARTILSHFGLSINPMTILNKLNTELIKLDGVLVEKAQKNKADVEPLSTLVGELKAQDQQVIAPHVESASIIPALWQAKVDYIQGHYIQQPGPEMDFDFSQE